METKNPLFFPFMFSCFYSRLFLSPFIPFGLTIQESPPTHPPPNRHIKQTPVPTTVSFVSPLWLWGCFLVRQQQINTGNGKEKRKEEKRREKQNFSFIVFILCSYKTPQFSLFSYTFFFHLFIIPSLICVNELCSFQVIVKVNVKAEIHINKIKNEWSLIKIMWSGQPAAKMVCHVVTSPCSLHRPLNHTQIFPQHAIYHYLQVPSSVTWLVAFFTAILRAMFFWFTYFVCIMFLRSLLNSNINQLVLLC